MNIRNESVESKPSILDNKDNNVPIISAALLGNIDELKSLIKAGVDINCKNERGEFPLMCAAMKGHTGCVQVLIDAGAKINEQDDDGYTALIYSMNTFHSDCLKALIKAEADLNLQTTVGETAISIASIASVEICIDYVRILLEAGARIDLQTNDKELPIDIAIGKKYSLEVVSLLLSKGAIPSDAAKLDMFLRSQDKNNELIYICYSLFCQQQENLQEEKNVKQGLLLEDKQYNECVDYMATLPLPPKDKLKRLRDDLIAVMDSTDYSINPLDLLKVTAEYDNPYYRLNLFKRPSDNKKIEVKDSVPLNEQVILPSTRM